MELRPYQKAAVDAVYTHLRTKDNNPCVVIPTGGRKTPVLATIVSDAIQKWNGRVMIVSHVKELLEQATDKIKTVYHDADVGIFSSGLSGRSFSGSVSSFTGGVTVTAFSISCCAYCSRCRLSFQYSYSLYAEKAKSAAQRIRQHKNSPLPFHWQRAEIYSKGLYSVTVFK